MKKRMAVLILMLVVLGLTTPTVEMQVNCDTMKQTCAEGAEVIRAVCLSQNGLAERCARDADGFFKSCMKQNGCPITGISLPSPPVCPDWCPPDPRTGICQEWCCCQP